LGYGIGSWVEKIKEANAEFARAKKGIAGVLAGALAFEKGATDVERYNRSLVLSNGITRELEQTAGRFVTNLDDVANTYRSVATSAGRMGLTQKQVMDLTKGAIATAKRFGSDGVSAATAIARALQTGTVRGFDPFNIALRNSLGNMKKLTQAQRFEHIQKALQGSLAIADAMSGGVSGALSRIRTTVDELIRDTTGPLFSEIARSLETWGQEIRKVGEEGKPLVEVFAGRLVDAFHIVQHISAEIKAHWKEIAAIWVGFKGAKLAGGLAGAFGGGGGLATGALGGPIGLAGAGAAVLGGKLLSDYAQRKMLEGEKENEIGKYKDVFSAAAKMRDAGFGTGVGGTGALGNKDYEAASKAFAAAVQAQGLEKLGGTGDINALVKTFGEQAASALGMPGKEVASLAGGLKQMIEAVRGQIDDSTPWLKPRDKDIKFAKAVNNFYGGIHLTQKFEDAEPDRIFQRFEDGLHSMVDKRTQALGAEAQGD
jgi:hypothetical protein